MLYIILILKAGAIIFKCRIFPQNIILFVHCVTVTCQNITYLHAHGNYIWNFEKSSLRYFNILSKFHLMIFNAPQGKILVVDCWYCFEWVLFSIFIFYAHKMMTWFILDIIHIIVVNKWRLLINYSPAINVNKSFL